MQCFNPQILPKDLDMKFHFIRSQPRTPSILLPSPRFLLVHLLLFKNLMLNFISFCSVLTSVDLPSVTVSLHRTKISVDSSRNAWLAEGMQDYCQKPLRTPNLKIWRKKMSSRFIMFALTIEMHFNMAVLRSSMINVGYLKNSYVPKFLGHQPVRNIHVPWKTRQGIVPIPTI